MNRSRMLGLAGLLAIAAIVTAACSSDDEPPPPTPVFNPTAAPSGDVPTVAPAATSAPAPEPTAPPAAPAPVAPGTPSGDPANGQALFNAQGCAACHITASKDRLVGPGLSMIGETAATRVAGQTAADYITESIVAPNAFVVPDFTPIMPATFAQSMTEAEIADLVAYLQSLE